MTYENIVETLYHIGENDEWDLIVLHNKYCKACGKTNDVIYENDNDFLETHFMNKPVDLVHAVQNGNYHYYDNYVKFDKYGNLESFNYGHVFPEDIANYLLTLSDDERSDFF